ncbi:hypothetical protein [Nocardia sp. BSTN01]|nr:hypothetical protein [Nocardia sp. BSTN01]
MRTAWDDAEASPINTFGTESPGATKRLGAGESRRGTPALSGE